MRGLSCLVILAALAFVAALAYSGSAPAGPPGRWTRVTTTNVANFAEPGLARTSDGVLHVAWHRPVGPLSEDIVHSAISPGGALVGGPVTIAGGWATLNQRPDLIVTPDGLLRVFFAGLHSTVSGDPLNQVLLTSSSSDGRSWSAYQRVTTSNFLSYGSAGIAAAVARDGAAVVAQGDPGNMFRFGIGAGPDFPYETRGCCVYDPGIGVDAVSGQVVLGWFALVNGNFGAYTQTITPSGAVGSPQYVPGTANADRTTANQPLQRTAVTGRVGAGGVYIAYGAGYPALTSVNLLRVGSARPLVVARASDIRNVTVAQAPEGRLWIIWESGGRYHATRTNRAATETGTATTVRPPSGTVSTFGLSGEGTRTPLDLVANAGTTSTVALWHTQVLPALEADAKGLKNAIQVKVTEAGDPVRGVRVRVGTKSDTTNARGIAVIRTKPGVATAIVTKPGYRRDTDRARVRPPPRRR